MSAKKFKNKKGDFYEKKFKKELSTYALLGYDGC